LLNNVAAILGSGAVAAVGDYESIQTYAVGSGGNASITFDLTDLVLKVSARGASGGNDWIDITINGTANNTIDLRHIIGDGSSAASQAYAALLSEVLLVVVLE